MRLRILCVLALGLASLATSAGCNLILGNKLYDLSDGGDESNPDATTALDGADLEAGAHDATTEGMATVSNEAGGEENTEDGGCTLTDTHSCGSCTNDCAQFPHVSATGLGCTGGMCTYACSPGYSDCADAGTGCGTALSGAANCGGCGVTCNSKTPLCAPSDAGVYGCASSCGAGQTNCSDTCSNVMTDSTHCGSCTTACPSSEQCISGTCACPTTAAPDFCVNACTNKQTDSANCGSCGHVCGGGETCQAGTCACPANQKLCNGTCVNVLGTDVNNCGACGTSCAMLPHVGTTGLSCAGGKCSYSCAAGFADCGNTGTGCSTSLGTATNCSACGAGCSGGTPVCSPSGSTYACTNGCSSGQTNCSGTCTTPATNPKNCGTCGTVCAASQSCPSGTCVCPAATPTLCGSACTNTQTDHANCGTCTHACPAAETCVSGNCACSSAANPDFCGSACTNLKTDKSNCGSCNTVCTGGQQCTNGSCQCPTNTIGCNGTCQTANSCGGCGSIIPTPGGSCGTCGTYVCNSTNTGVTCVDPGTTNSCPTWCSSQPAPSGVAASDYQCVDFDNGLPSTSVWAQTLAGMGALSRSTSQFDSSPASLMTSMVANSADTAAISWSVGGNKTITGISVSLDVNPVTAPAIVPPSAELDLIEINTGSNTVVVYYIEQSSFDSGYTGLGMRWVFAPSAAIGSNCVLNTTLSNNVWNQLQLNVSEANDTISVVVNGTTIGCPCCSELGFDTSVSAKVSVGAIANAVGSTTFSWTGFYDNIQASVLR